MLNCTMLLILLNTCLVSGSGLNVINNEESSNLISDPKCSQINSNSISYGQEANISYDKAPIIYATHSATAGSHGPELAVDNNHETYAIAVPNQSFQPAWWMGEFYKYELIKGATIVSSPDFINAQYLKYFSVLISYYSYIHDPDFSYADTCIKVCDEGVIQTKTMIAYKCQYAIFGKFVVVRARSGPISIAEVAFLR